MNIDPKFALPENHYIFSTLKKKLRKSFGPVGKLMVWNIANESGTPPSMNKNKDGKLVPTCLVSGKKPLEGNESLSYNKTTKGLVPLPVSSAATGERGAKDWYSADQKGEQEKRKREGINQTAPFSHFIEWRNENYLFSFFPENGGGKSPLALDRFVRLWKGKL